MPWGIRSPSSLEQALERHAFPRPDDPGLFAGIFDGVDVANNLVVIEIGVLPFTRAHFLVGMEALFVAMAERPEVVGRLLHIIADYQIAVIRRAAALGAEGIRGEDDYGSQTALMISPGMWRRLIKPELARIVRAAKEEGLLFIMHSCGRIMEIVPDLVELGVDVLDPIQQQANDQGELKRLYGHRLSFKDGLSTQGALSSGHACRGGGGRPGAHPPAGSRRRIHPGSGQRHRGAGGQLPGLPGRRGTLRTLPAGALI